MIQISDDYRIIDLDDLQYCIQKKGKSKWVNLSYHRSLPQMVSRMAEMLGSDASRETKEKFKAGDMPDQILALPPKEKVT